MHVDGIAMSFHKIDRIKVGALMHLDPRYLSQYLVKQRDGTMCVDMRAALRVKEDEKKLINMLSAVYKWDYSQDIEDITIYFELEGDYLIGGIYDSSQENPRVNRIKLSSYTKDQNCPYIYSKKDWLKIKKNVTRT